MFNFFKSHRNIKCKKQKKLIKSIGPIIPTPLNWFFKDKDDSETFSQFCEALNQITDSDDKQKVFSGLISTAISASIRYPNYLTELLKRGARLLPDTEGYKFVKFLCERNPATSIQALLIIYGIFPFNEFKEEYKKTDLVFLINYFDETYEHCHNLPEELINIEAQINDKYYLEALIAIETLKSIIRHFETTTFNRNPGRPVNKKYLACQILMADVYKGLEQKEQFCHNSLALMDEEGGRAGSSQGANNGQAPPISLQDGFDESRPLLPSGMQRIN